MHIAVHDALADIDIRQWNALVTDHNPFMRHEFLSGLELAGCVHPDTGWQPHHIVIYDDAQQQQLLAAMPCYIKSHSYGEYIFDWAWADAFRRHGLNYYPKLSNAVPFTPATGPRWLLKDNPSYTAKQLVDALIEFALQTVQDHELSSFHSLFLDGAQAQSAVQCGLALRSSSQFHWQNRGYQNFDEFLSELSAKKRKNIKRERRRVTEAEVHYRWLTGAELTSDAIQQMAQFYRRTIHRYGGQEYLNQAFFTHLQDNFAAQTLVLVAEHHEQTIAAGLYFRSDTTLYGRYWGALADFHSLHFETCYYQPIEWCIAQGVQHFEAGAQGEHKLARGLEPTTTYSCHWVNHPQFRVAIDQFLQDERDHIEEYQALLQKHSPYRQRGNDASSPA